MKIPTTSLVLSVLLALFSLAYPSASAPAQVPAGLLRLDPPEPSNDGVKINERRRAKIRGAHAPPQLPHRRSHLGRSVMNFDL